MNSVSILIPISDSIHYEIEGSSNVLFPAFAVYDSGTLYVTYSDGNVEEGVFTLPTGRQSCDFGSGTVTKKGSSMYLYEEEVDLGHGEYWFVVFKLTNERYPASATYTVASNKLRVWYSDSTYGDYDCPYIPPANARYRWSDEQRICGSGELDTDAMNYIEDGASVRISWTYADHPENIDIWN